MHKLCFKPFGFTLLPGVLERYLRQSSSYKFMLIRYLCNWSTNDDPSVDEPATFILVCALATVVI